MALAVGVSDLRQVTGDPRHLTVFISLFCIGADIQTHKEIYNFPYAGFVLMENISLTKGP